MTQAGKQAGYVSDLPAVDPPTERWYRVPGNPQPVMELIGVKRAEELERKGWVEVDRPRDVLADPTCSCGFEGSGTTLPEMEAALGRHLDKNGEHTRRAAS